jgi:endonuclease/exonuclease/phosphatase (EEP) superfamily protein YafD
LMNVSPECYNQVSASLGLFGKVIQPASFLVAPPLTQVWTSDNTSDNASVLRQRPSDHLTILQFFA